jgi:predicted ATPase/DNA-binding winged helix-turn-helix (wHTH) protein
VTRTYQLGPFQLDSEASVLTQEGVPVALGSRAVAVLTTLVKRMNEFVQKAAIMDAAWPGIVVEESNLAVQISAIRRVLSQAPGGAHWIETLPRRGYRFVGPVAELEDPPHGGRGARPRSNLPEPLTSFVGRERELVDIKRLLPNKRLLTLVGMGGIGKTRLALQSAAEVIDAYRDGVWLVELGSITDPSLVPTTVAQVVGVREKTGTPLTVTLCAHLKARQVLLILDNCEHLLDPCATLIEAVLRTAAEVTVIATSRESLRVEGEQTYPLQPLLLPDPSADEEAIGRSEAVQLFVERAQRQLPAFELTAARAAAVARLCIHLDGIPLALELAAARVPSLSVEQINARIDDRFRLLTGGSHAAQLRQHTLRATLDWSYDLLAQAERTVLRRLSIFPSSFTLEAAASVASDDEIDEFAVIDLLSQLVARSLVVADTKDAGARYRLLETTRAYAFEHLTEEGEVDAIKPRHARYFRELFERATDDWMRMTDDDWHTRYAEELHNVRAALDWGLGAGGEPANAIGLAGASGPLWADLLSEGRQRLEYVVAHFGAEIPAADQARTWLWLGAMSAIAEPTQAVAALQRAVDLYRRLGDRLGLGYSLGRLGAMLARAGRVEQATLVLAEAFPVLEHANLPKPLGRYYESIGFLARRSGDLGGARVHFEKALSLYQGAGADAAASGVLVNLADTTWALGDLDTALGVSVETVERLRKSPLPRKEMLGASLTNLAGVHTERGELSAALALAREGLPLLEEAGYAWSVLDHFALRAALAGKLANAARLAGYSDSAFAAKDASREPNEARAHKRLQAMLRNKLDPGEFARLIADGAKMSEDQACRLALEE